MMGAPRQMRGSQTIEMISKSSSCALLAWSHSRVAGLPVIDVGKRAVVAGHYRITDAKALRPSTTSPVLSIEQ